MVPTTIFPQNFSKALVMLHFAAILMLAALIILSPWPVAGNLAYARFGLLMLTFLTLVTSTAEHIRAKDSSNLNQSPRTMWIWLLLLIGIGYSAFQTIDLNAYGWSGPIDRPARIVSVVGSVDTGNQTSAINSISIYPAASRIKLVDLILGVAVFFATTITIRRSKDASTLLISLVFVGAAASFFGILQAVSWNGDLFWQYELIQGGRVFGSFVNRNNAAGFLIITLAAAISVAAYHLMIAAEDAERISESPQLGRRVEKSRSSMLRKLTEVLARLETHHLYIALAIGVTIVGILMTLSRGGVIAMAIVLIMSALMLRKTGGVLITTFAILIMTCILAFIGYLGVDEKLSERFEQLSIGEMDTTPRIAHWNDMIPAITESTVGVGGGTYRVFSPQFQSFDFDRIYAHAENIYIETLIELGYVGLVLLFLVISICFWSSWQLVRATRPIDRSLGLFGLATLVGTGIASFFDFGLYQPANMIAMAVAMGVVTRRAQTKNHRVKTPAIGQSIGSKACTYVGCVAILCCVVWAGYYSYGVESLRWAKRTIRLAEEHRNASDPLLSKKSLSQIQSALQVAGTICPHNADVEFSLGELEMLRYQKTKAKMIAESIAEQTRREDISEQERNSWLEYTPDKIWASASLTTLNADVFAAMRSGNPERLTELKQDPLVESHLKAAYRHYQNADALRIRSTGTNLRLAQLAPVIEPVDNAAAVVSDRINTALDSPFPSTEVLFEAGLLSLNAGQKEKAAELWSKCLLKPAGRKFEQPVVTLSMTEMPIQPFFEQVLPQEPETLLRVVKNYFRSPDLILPKRLLLIHTEAVARAMKDSLPQGDYYYFLAETQRLSDQFDLAAESYKQALEFDAEQTIWRFNYSQCLRELKRYDEAIQQLQKCQLQPSPIFPKIKPLIDRIRNQQSTEFKNQRRDPPSPSISNDAAFAPAGGSTFADRVVFPKRTTP